MIHIRPAQHADLSQLAALCVLLWPEGSVEEHRAELATSLATGMNGTLPAAVFVAHDDAGALIGFLEVGLRSHADGCDTAQPVGFIEGWFVLEQHRGRGVGRALMHAAEDWSRACGCLEIASDALIDNSPSHHAHRALGFEVVDRCVHFRKPLRPPSPR